VIQDPLSDRCLTSVGSAAGRDSSARFSVFLADLGLEQQLNMGFGVWAFQPHDGDVRVAI